MATKKTPEGSKYLAVRAFRSEAAAQSGKRGRRLVVNTETGAVQAMGSTWDPETRETSYEGMTDSGLSASSVEELSMALATSKTNLVVEDPGLTAYVNEHDGQLPLEGLKGTGPDDYVDLRPAALARVERIAEKAAKKESEALASA